ncbi:MAG TPA: hypothetical protein P5572_07845 [Phycisphaerae bacterium]|nr:hypothetical protein [Phycisphaerales bacterium]HRX84914.1 hypothetical protein [Phycisphaerae bacterium]
MRFATAFILITALTFPAIASAGVLVLNTSTERSETGYYRLSWEVPDRSTAVEVEESASTDFALDDTHVLYNGTDHATVISGRQDGVYHYRARIAGGDWSAPITVAVVHHSMTKAIGFLALGAVVFMATAVLILGGHLKYRREQNAAAGEVNDA